MEKFRVKVNSKDYRIELDPAEDNQNKRTVLLNGRKCEIDVNLEQLSSIVMDNNTHKINGVFEYNGVPVKLQLGKDLLEVEVEEDLPIAKTDVRKSAKNAGRILAPMPGKIISVGVKVGDQVEADGDLLIMEAMKMENRIKSPISGKVKNIHVKTGGTCNTQDLLVEIEP